jgi:hypothetical protein
MDILDWFTDIEYQDWDPLSECEYVEAEMESPGERRARGQAFRVEEMYNFNLCHVNICIGERKYVNGQASRSRSGTKSIMAEVIMLVCAESGA